MKSQRQREKIEDLVQKKSLIGDFFNHLRAGRDPKPLPNSSEPNNGSTTTKIKNEMKWISDSSKRDVTMSQLLMIMMKLDQEIGSMLEKDGEKFNKRWGYLCRSGLHDRSALCRQIEKWADIYTSRVSNFNRYTPFMYFKSTTQTLAHDPSNKNL